jgi:hypothetical protein
MGKLNDMLSGIKEPPVPDGVPYEDFSRIQQQNLKLQEQLRQYEAMGPGLCHACAEKDALEKEIKTLKNTLKQRQNRINWLEGGNQHRDETIARLKSQPKGLNYNHTTEYNKFLKWLAGLDTRDFPNQVGVINRAKANAVKSGQMNFTRQSIELLLIWLAEGKP